VRSTEFPWGLVDLTPKEKVTVGVSNVLTLFSLRVIRLCLRHNVMVAIENPLSSILWCIPELIKLFGNNGFECKTDFCCWGEAWRKSTRVWSWGIDLSLASRRCGGRGVCSRSNRPHTTLSGLDPNGVFWTKRAEQYPLPWTTMLAQLGDSSNART
jgi:hypothetical protein